MINLTPIMLQTLRTRFRQHHDLYPQGPRIQAGFLECLLADAMASDRNAGYGLTWRPETHDTEYDIVASGEAGSVPIQVKSGKVTGGGRLRLSGHRLGRFAGDLRAMTDEINANSTDIVSVSYDRRDEADGTHHDYGIRIVASEMLNGLDADRWERNGSRYRQLNALGVIFALCPTMSWQIWWEIPLDSLRYVATISC